MFKISVIDSFINECKSNGSEITYDNFGTINESYSIGGEPINIPSDIFEAYIKYVDVFENDMVTLNEFEKIKSFSEFIEYKEANSEEGEESPEGEEGEESPEGEEGEESPEGEEGEESPEGEEGEESPEGEESNESVKVQPEAVKPTKSETEDDKSHQTEIDLKTTDGEETAQKTYDKINNMGRPDKSAGGVAGEEEGKELEDKTTKVDPVKENVGVEDVEGVEGEDDDPEAGITPDLAKTDGEQTSNKIEDDITKKGEPKVISSGDAGEEEGKELEDKTTKVDPVSEKKNLN